MLRAVEVWGPLAAILVGFIVLAWLGARAGKPDRDAGMGQPVGHEHVSQFSADPLSSAPLPQPAVYKEEREQAAASHQGGRGRHRDGKDDGELGLGNTGSEEIVINAATVMLLIAAMFFGDYLEKGQAGTGAIREPRREVFKTLHSVPKT